MTPPGHEPHDVQVLTFGCRLNLVESEAMRRAALACGRTNLVIVNTCAVTAEAARQARQAIRRIKREWPGAEIVVTGCAALVAAARKGLTGRHAIVSLPGGDLDIAWRQSDGHVAMTGPVEFEFETRLDPDLFKDVAA